MSRWGTVFRPTCGRVRPRQVRVVNTTPSGSSADFENPTAEMWRLAEIQAVAPTYSYSGPMEVRLLYFDDCPNWRDAAAQLDALAAENPALVVEHQVVDTPALAERTGFFGSPSIQVAGRDLFATGAESVGLSCRIYQTPDGPAGAPTIEQLRAAIGHVSRDVDRET